jgi:hypothetical protein
MNGIWHKWMILHGKNGFSKCWCRDRIFRTKKEAKEYIYECCPSGAKAYVIPVMIVDNSIQTGGTNAK